MNVKPGLMHEFSSAVKDAIISAAGQKRQDYLTGTVTSVETDGTVWVDVTGGVQQMPIVRVTADCKPGDLVTFTIDNGIASLGGNASDISAGRSSVEHVEHEVTIVEKRVIATEIDAQRAHEAAEAAQADADRAYSAAEDAQTSANEAAQAAAVADGKAVAAAQSASEAKTSAATANTYANAALDQLGVVQDVIGVLDYAVEHGTFSHTQDTEVVSGKVYFTYDSQSGDYTPVVDPQEASLSSYYELSYNDDSMGDFIMSHLAVTSRGLWVLPNGIGSSTTPASGETQGDSDARQGSGYKTLLSSEGMYIYDGNGVQVGVYGGDGIDYASGKRWHVGSNDAYILYTPASGSTPARIIIGGQNIQLGSNKTLAEWEAELDGTLIFKIHEEYDSDQSTVTLTAHVYQGGNDIADQYPDSCYAWYRKDEGEVPLTPIGDGREQILTRESVGYGAAIVCHFTPPNDSVLLDEDDDILTESGGTPISGRTPSGDYVRLADLETTATVFDTDKLLIVGTEQEKLVTVDTLKDLFGDGDYERLDNRPSIEGVTLSGDKTFPDLGIFQTDGQGYDVADDYTLTTMDINALWANAQPVQIGA